MWFIAIHLIFAITFATFLGIRKYANFHYPYPHTGKAPRWMRTFMKYDPFFFLFMAYFMACVVMLISLGPSKQSFRYKCEVEQGGIVVMISGSGRTCINRAAVINVK